MKYFRFTIMPCTGATNNSNTQIKQTYKQTMYNFSREGVALLRQDSVFWGSLLNWGISIRGGAKHMRLKAFSRVTMNPLSFSTPQYQGSGFREEAGSEQHDAGAIVFGSGWPPRAHLLKYARGSRNFLSVTIGGNYHKI